MRFEAKIRIDAENIHEATNSIRKHLFKRSVSVLDIYPSQLAKETIKPIRTQKDARERILILSECFNIDLVKLSKKSSEVLK